MKSPLVAAALEARPHARQLRASVALGAGAVAAAVALLATSGYLISRAAERPAMLTLLVAIVLVRCFGMARAGLRYGERLVSHDLAFRVLADLRVRFYERLVATGGERPPGRRPAEPLRGRRRRAPAPLPARPGAAADRRGGRRGGGRRGRAAAARRRPRARDRAAGRGGRGAGARRRAGPALRPPPGAGARGADRGPGRGHRRRAGARRARARGRRSRPRRRRGRAARAPAAPRRARRRSGRRGRDAAGQRRRGRRRRRRGRRRRGR